ncbi:sensor domain-containing protein [Mycolicibacterium grossiae]|nr:sensor domain-containing protein [Mycolicibacterium grossiae]QEM45703.1 sensor domain-containing protein [Mycolicibacterium grossiae]
MGSRLLTTEEADAAMHTSGMTVDTTMSSMVGDSGNVEPAACLPAASVAQDGVYAGSGWDAVRVQSLHEPGEDFDHLLHQAVVEFPAPRDAAAFYADSIGTWAACTGTYTYTPTGVIWNVGESTQDGAVLTVSTSQQDATWLCQRALSAAAAVVVDVLTCSGDDRSAMAAAATVAQQIAARATNQ